MRPATVAIDGRFRPNQFDPSSTYVNLASIHAASAGGSGTRAVYKAAYDLAGNGRVTTFDYDVLGRIESVLVPAPGGGETTPKSTYAYQDLGTSSVVTIEDKLGNGVVRTANAWGLVTSENQEGATTTYNYDPVGNLLKLTDPVSNDTHWTYEGLDRVLTEKNEFNDARSFVYDLASNLTSKTDRNGRVTEYAYDDLYRLTSEEWLVSSSVIRTLSFAYDTASQLVTASDPAAEYEYTYDALGRLDVETQNIVGLPEVVFDNGYNLNGARTSVSASINGTLDFLRTYTRDERDRVTQLLEEEQSGGNGVVRKEIDFGYNAANQYDLIERYEGSTPTLIASSAFDYDGAGRLKDLHHTNSTTLARYQFVYDAASRITEINSHVDGVSTFTHDTKNQLTAADHSSSGPADETYSFDANGNRNSSGYTVTANNRISTDGTYNYTYDDEGNRLSRTKISDSTKEEYTWDHRNRLVTITFKNGGGTITKTVDQTYDVFNQWIKRTVDADGAGSGTAVDTYFAHESGQITFQWEDADGSGTTDDPELAHRYTWAEGVDHFLADEQLTTSPTAAGNVLWGLGDHLGTLRDIVDLISSTVSVVNHRDYNSFGSLTSETNSSIHLVFGFTSRPFDVATGKQNNLWRWYDPDLNEWLSEDPIGFEGGLQKLNGYLGNSPLTATDPSGLAEEHHHEFLKQWLHDNGFIDKNGKSIPGKVTGGEFNVHDPEHGTLLSPEDHTRKPDGIHCKDADGKTYNKNFIEEWTRRMQKDGSITYEDAVAAKEAAKAKYPKQFGNGTKATEEYKNQKPLDGSKRSEGANGKLAKKAAAGGEEVAEKFGKRLLKKAKAALPGPLGLLFAVFTFPGQVEAKGMGAAVGDELLDSVPGVDLAKAGTELVFGDWIRERTPEERECAAAEARRQNRQRKDRERYLEKFKMPRNESHFGSGPQLPSYFD